MFFDLIGISNQIQGGLLQRYSIFLQKTTKKKPLSPDVFSHRLIRAFIYLFTFDFLAIHHKLNLKKETSR